MQSEEETDLLQRSTKKIKSGSKEFEGGTLGLHKYDDLFQELLPDCLENKGSNSYKNTLLGKGTSGDKEVDNDYMSVSEKGPF